jgi:ribonuclease J
MIAGHKLSFFHTCHNIADSSGIAIDTSYGNIIYTGDFIIENNAEERYLCDLNAIAKISEKPTILLMTESVYANKQGYTAPNHKLTPIILHDFEEAKGRIFVSLFSTNAYNIGEVFRLSLLFKKKIICYDSETQEVLETFLKTTGSEFPKGLLAELDDINRINPNDLVVLVCGYGANLYRKMSIIALGESDDKLVSLTESDTFIMAAPANVNVEVIATDAIDDLYRSGAKIINLSRQNFLRMHASEEDIKMMISLTKPKYYMPIKGAFRFLLANAKLALHMGIGLSHQNVFVLDNGMILNIDEKGAHIGNESIPTGNLLIDGMGVADSNGKTMAERERLSADGVVILACTISKGKRQIVAGPDVQMRGFMFLKDADSILKTVTNIFTNTINDYLAKPSCNLDEAKQVIYENCLKAIRRETNKNPVIMPLILEILD